MKVSIIIPTYNEEDVIASCIESLLSQSYKEIEIIVVDDGSRDKTLEQLSQYKSYIKILTQKHKGAGASRNLGAESAVGEILVFVDADMTFEKSFIRNLVNPIEERKVVGTFSKEEYLANKNNIWAKCWNINRGFPMDRMHPKNYPNEQEVFRAILKKEFDKVGGFDDKAGYIDDWSLSKKLGVKAIAAPSAIFYHKNPSTLSEVFVQSRWMAKRKYKLGSVGIFLALFRISLPISLVIGSVKSFQYSLPEFLAFKVISDFGSFLGILEFSIFGKSFK